MSKKYTVPHKDYSLNELYDVVASMMGKANANYDCRCINVAPNIQDGFYNHYIDFILSKDETETVHSARVDVTMMLAIYGPKIDVSLEDDEVEVFEGFIC